MYVNLADRGTVRPIQLSAVCSTSMCSSIRTVSTNVQYHRKLSRLYVPMHLHTLPQWLLACSHARSSSPTVHAEQRKHPGAASATLHLVPCIQRVDRVSPSTTTTSTVMTPTLLLSSIPPSRPAYQHGKLSGVYDGHARAGNSCAVKSLALHGHGAAHPRHGRQPGAGQVLRPSTPNRARYGARSGPGSRTRRAGYGRAVESEGAEGV